MRFLYISIIALLSFTLLACPAEKGVPSSAPTPGSKPTAASDKLVLVEAQLATRMQNGQLAENEFCEANVPFLEIRGGTVEAQCKNSASLLQVEEESQTKGTRTLRTKQGISLQIEESGPQRYKVSGNPCNKAPQFYVVYPEAKGYRQEWLRGASCPTEDMKLAH